jgi:NAD(P)H-nitrite reductase large subunit
MASRTARNDSDINSPDFEKLSKSHLSIGEKRELEKYEIVTRDRKALTRKVIFEKYKNYSAEELKSIMYKKMKKRIFSLVEESNYSNNPIDIYRNKISDNIQLDTSNVITEEDEVLEYYRNLNVEF